MPTVPNDKTTDRVAGLIRQHGGSLFGKYRGVVTKVGTGDDLGRIRATIPSVLGDKLDSVWIEPAVPYAGKDHGMLMLPEEGDGVWIEFEAGHPWLPIWTGFYWGKDQKPKAATEKVRVIATKRGHQIVLDDDKDEIRIENGKGPSIVIGTDSITLEVSGKKIVLSKEGLDVNNKALKVT